MRNAHLYPWRVFSKRWTVARGNVWVSERIVSDENKDRWMEVFQKDEPNVEFVLSRIQPK